MPCCRMRAYCLCDDAEGDGPMDEVCGVLIDPLCIIARGSGSDDKGVRSDHNSDSI